MNIKWVGPVLDPSGYSKANRGYIEALLKQNVNLELQTDYFNIEYSKKDEYGAYWYDELVANKVDYDKVIFNCIPNNLANLVEKDKFNISLSTWETDRIPESWVNIFNNYVQGIIVPSKYNYKTYLRSGVKIPIKVVPHCLDMDKYSKKPDTNLKTPDELDNKFKFLSVFQWTERKNPYGLLKAYFTQFLNNKNVVLILKIYGSSHSIQEQKRIKNLVQQCKNDLNLTNTPDIYFIGNQLSEEEMIALYHYCDCFVLPSRSEGFGLPILEAMACGKPVITSDYGAGKELMTKNGLLIETHETPVFGMSWINEYDGTQNWGEPDIPDLKRNMYYIYQNINLHSILKKENLNKALTDYSYEKIGKQLMKAIAEFEPEKPLTAS